jgi:hypothetical protein
MCVAGFCIVLCRHIGQVAVKGILINTEQKKNGKFDRKSKCSERAITHIQRPERSLYDVSWLAHPRHLTRGSKLAWCKRGFIHT